MEGPTQEILGTRRLCCVPCLLSLDVNRELCFRIRGLQPRGWELSGDPRVSTETLFLLVHCRISGCVNRGSGPLDALPVIKPTVDSLSLVSLPRVQCLLSLVMQLFHLRIRQNAVEVAKVCGSYSSLVTMSFSRYLSTSLASIPCIHFESKPPFSSLDTETRVFKIPQGYANSQQQNHGCKKDTVSLQSPLHSAGPNA